MGKGTKEREEKDSNGKKMAKNEMSKNNKEADNKVQERERDGKNEKGMNRSIAHMRSSPQYRSQVIE